MRPVLSVSGVRRCPAGATPPVGFEGAGVRSRPVTLGGPQMNSRSWARRLAGAAGAALALAATTVAIDAAPAAAIDAGGPVVVDRSTGWDSAPYKPMDAFCPDNTELIGTGAT